ncbi:hypothetical protein DL240_05810 [Lujinxingia litoralis]|uniref:Mandelate racemase/muconate lactonizing enzyme C-terminal domain-containing protein n=1 Tax=Lujinxingia litoralis TaxID=2211119 RepID=A0A328C9L0_9DELT|nr:enolase C-terminal domain-like protein [Lujinxingia litoralis]RAL23674.1 hypothetical protein DL240_05810 [Lujinxingia litoralis]
MTHPLIQTEMQVLELQWAPLDLDLLVPIRTAAATYRVRHVVMLRARVRIEGREVVGYGECSPLPGWNAESRDDVIAALTLLRDDPNLSAPLSLGPGQLDQALGQLALLPTLRFALELALLDALARHHSLPLAAILGLASTATADDLHQGVPLQTTFALDAPLITAQRAAVAVGNSELAIKLKVGLDPLQGDLERIRLVREHCPNARLRLDANGAFSPEQTLRFARAVAEFDIDFIEEPVSQLSVDAFQYLQQASPVPIAADESASPPAQARALIDARAVGALVLKPMSIGGLLPTLELIRLADAAHIQVVVSNLIESALGRRAAAHLVIANRHLHALQGCHGLKTGGWLRADVAPRVDITARQHLRLDDTPGVGFIPRPWSEQPGDAP